MAEKKKAYTSMTVRIPCSLRRALKELAFYTGRSQNEIVVERLKYENLLQEVRAAKEKYDERSPM